MRALPTSETDARGEYASPRALVAASGVREEADTCSAIVVNLNSGWRVIACRNGIQWILQQRAGTRHGGARWDGKSYCRTRGGLMLAVRALTGEMDARALAVLERLPERMEARS